VLKYGDDLKRKFFGEILEAKKFSLQIITILCHVLGLYCVHIVCYRLSWQLPNWGCKAKKTGVQLQPLLQRGTATKWNRVLHTGHLGGGLPPAENGEVRNYFYNSYLMKKL